MWQYRAPPLRRALPLRCLCLLCLLPLASGLLDLYDDTFEERIEKEPVLLCVDTHCVAAARLCTGCTYRSPAYVPYVLEAQGS